MLTYGVPVTDSTVKQFDNYTTMDLYKTLTSGHSRANTDRIVSYISDDPERFAALFGLFKKGEYTIIQRAAWAVSNCTLKFPELVFPYLGELVLYLKKENIHDAVKRNILRILQGVAIPEQQEGDLMDICFRFLLNKKEPVAIRVFSMQVLANLSRRYPEIRPELRVIIEDELPFAKPGFASRGRKILREFGKG